MRKKIKKKNRKLKKTRKKRTTIKEAFDNGYKQGHDECENKLVVCTFEIINKMIEEYNDTIQRYPRNTKFVELQLDSITDLRERLIYSDGYTGINVDIHLKKSGDRPKIQPESEGEDEDEEV